MQAADLPAEIWLRVFASLASVRDLAKLQCVCSSWRIWAGDALLWKALYQQEFPRNALPRPTTDNSMEDDSSDSESSSSDDDGEVVTQRACDKADVEANNIFVDSLYNIVSRRSYPNHDSSLLPNFWKWAIQYRRRIETEWKDVISKLEADTDPQGPAYNSLNLHTRAGFRAKWFYRMATPGEKKVRVQRRWARRRVDWPKIEVHNAQERDMLFILGYEHHVTEANIWWRGRYKGSLPNGLKLIRALKTHGLIKLKQGDPGLAEMLLTHSVYLCSRGVEKGWSGMNIDWGGALLYLANAKEEQRKQSGGKACTQEEIERMFKEAEQRITKKASSAKAHKHEEDDYEAALPPEEGEEHNLPKGYKEYNLACVAAVRGNEEECIMWLRKCEEMEAYKDRHLWNTWQIDCDFDDLRDRPWFKEMMAGIASKLAAAAVAV